MTQLKRKEGRIEAILPVQIKLEPHTTHEQI